ncbi:MAG: PAS domain S-box protein [Terriglobales bacterium]
MQTGQITPTEAPPPHHGEDAFQKLLLQFSDATADGTPSSSVIQMFCRSTREFFQVDGAYFWRVSPPDELIASEADGLLAEDFRGRHLKAQDSAVAIEAVRQRRTVYVNRVDPNRYPMAGEYNAKSMMAAPLVVANEVIGAAVFLSASDPDFFHDDLATKATILAGQLGGLLEANRLTQLSREQHRRAEILTEVAQAVHGLPDTSTVAESVAAHLRMLLNTRLVCILLREGATVQLHAVAAETPQLASSVRSRYDRKGLQFAADLTARAMAAGEVIAVAIDSQAHALGELVPAGMLLAAPIRTSRAQGAILVYPRQQGPFRPEEKSLLAAVSGFGAVAIANAELCGTARAQAHELQQLLDISSELGSIGDLDQFMQRFALRAADLLGFDRAFLGLLEEGVFRIRWGAERGRTERLELVLPEGPTTRALINREIFWCDDASKVPGANLEALARFNVRQMLTVPLLDTRGEVLGMFGVLDRLDRTGISQSDIRSARVLAAQVAVALESTRNLHLSEQHRRRAESLMALALELNSQLQLPEFARSFVTRASDLMESPMAALAVKQSQGLEIVAVHGTSISNGRQDTLLPRLEDALTDSLSRRTEALVCGQAAALLGDDVSSALGWEDCCLVRLQGSTGELVGVLCLANRQKPLEKGDQQLLQAVAAHASIALENARLFTRMHQANRHWIEIFDAITDFIVAHDQSDKVLRVNRSLADFIGVQPQELIGVSMSGLMVTDDKAPQRSCPFCRSNMDDAAADEYVLPVLDRTYIVATSRVHSATSEGLQTIHVLKDITDRREAERRYRELFDNIQEGVFFATPAGRFVEVNDALVRMLGYGSREELLQADIRSQVCFSAGQYDEFTHQMQQHGSARNQEQTLRRPDGSAVHVLVNAFAVRDSQQRTLQYRGVMLDISGLKTFQSELHRERDFSGKILNHTQSLILVADTSGLISYANRRWYEMGYQQHQLLGRPLEELIAPPRRQAMAEAFATTRTGQQVDNLEIQIARGQEVGRFSVNLSPMRDEQGTVTSIVVVMSDITDAATLQAKLMHAEKMAAVGQLVSGVAHEVNNPLTAILGFTDLLLENPEVPDAARKDLRVILQEAQRTKQIVQNLLSFARQMPPQKSPVQLNAIIHRTVQLRAYDFRSRGAEVIEHLDENLQQVIGDGQQLQQVFLNILNNAYDAVRETGRPPRIEITTVNRGALVEVSFSDNGQGISSPDRIFDPFFTTKDVGKGTGLGLSICYGILREHGGEIACHNNPSGEGATFTVRLPALAIAVVTGGVQP